MFISLSDLWYKLRFYSRLLQDWIFQFWSTIRAICVGNWGFACKIYRWISGGHEKKANRILCNVDRPEKGIVVGQMKSEKVSIIIRWKLVITAVRFDNEKQIVILTFNVRVRNNTSLKFWEIPCRQSLKSIFWVFPVHLFGCFSHDLAFWCVEPAKTLRRQER